MPLDPPPPLMASAPAETSSMVPGMSALAGMGEDGQTVTGLLRMASELLLKAARLKQMQGDQMGTTQLAQIMSQLTDVAASEAQGMDAGPMASNAMGAPPPPGPMPANSPTMASAAQQTPPSWMMPRA